MTAAVGTDLRSRFLIAAALIALLASLLPAATPQSAQAAGGGTVALAALGTPVGQDFNTLAITGTMNATLPTGWYLAESGTSSRNNDAYAASNGTDNAGDVYSFGAAASTERAFGTLLSGTLTPRIGASFTNNTGAIITTLTVSYTGEQWRLGATGRQDRLDFQWSVDASDLSSGTWTDADALDFIGPISAGTTGALDGNASANRASISSAVTGLSIANGATVWIRWSDFNAAGADDGLGVDDFSLTPFSGPVAPVATCGTTLFAADGFPATRTVTGRDADGIVTSLTIDSVTPDPGTISIGPTTPAGAVGGTASATVTVGSTTPLGTYTVVVRATNNDTTPQSGTCNLTVSVEPVRTIGEVQGTVGDTNDGFTHRSPFAPSSGNGTGQAVFVHGVVTQKFLARTSAGANQFAIFIQNTPASDDDEPNSSDGLYIFMGGFADILRLYGGPAYLPAVGDEVVLRGNVVEFFNLTQLSSPRLVAITDTELDPDVVTPPIEADPPDDLADANRFWERGEGMRFLVDADSHVIAARDVFPSTADGEVWVIRGDHPIANRANPYERLVYRDPHPLDDIGPAGSFDNGNGMRILLTSHGLKALAGSNLTLIEPARTYDTITNEMTGALYFAFGKYSVEVEQQPVLVPGVDPALNAPPTAADAEAEFATSDYNVENLYDRRDDPFDGCDFTGNAGCPGVSPPFDYVPASEAVYLAHLNDLAQQIAGPMHAPDLLMIQEAEDQDICTVSAGAMVCGATDNRDGKPDTLQELALAILAAGGPAYDTAYDRNGADDRGIVSAFMFRTDSVELLPADASDPVLGSAPTVDYRGAPLAYNTDVSNPKALNADLPADVNLDTGFDGTNVYTRPPQVGHFRVWRDGIGGSVFTDLYAISNHFSSTPDARVGQRTEQSVYNVAIIEALLAADADRVISGGDFNVYPRPDDPFAPGQLYACNPLPCDVGPSDQLGPFYDAGIHNLWDTLVADVPRSAYSYNFVGMIQTLDMQFATDGQFADLVEVRAGHFNADFPADYDGDIARGASDHDPQLARWFTDVTIARLRALVDYYVDTGDLSASKERLLDNRLDRAARFLARGQTSAYLAQLEAFGDQAQDLAPTHLTQEAADALEGEANRLATL